MTPNSNEPNRQDLMELAQLLRQERPQPSGMQLDSIKERVLRSGSKVRRGSMGGLSLRTRIAALSVLILMFAVNVSSAAASMFNVLIGKSGSLLGITPPGSKGNSLSLSAANGSGTQYAFSSLKSSMGNDSDSNSDGNGDGNSDSSEGDSDSDSDSDDAAESEYCPDDGGDDDDDGDSDSDKGGDSEDSDDSDKDGDDDNNGGDPEDSDDSDDDSKGTGKGGDDSDSDAEACEPPGKSGPRMTGGGNAPTATPPGGTVHHGFQLRCDPSDPRQNLEVNWGNGQKFHLETLTEAKCLDDPKYVANPPSSNFDTYFGKGTGRLNQGNGTAEWCFVDAGEPGKNGDRISIIVKKANGAVVLSVVDQINQGNHQAHGSFSPAPAPPGSCSTSMTAQKTTVKTSSGPSTAFNQRR